MLLKRDINNPGTAEKYYQTLLFIESYFDNEDVIIILLEKVDVDYNTTNKIR